MRVLCTAVESVFAKTFHEHVEGENTLRSALYCVYASVLEMPSILNTLRGLSDLSQHVCLTTCYTEGPVRLSQHVHVLTTFERSGVRLACLRCLPKFRTCD